MRTPSLIRDLRFTGQIDDRGTVFDVPVSAIDALDPFLLERFQLETPLQYRQVFAYTNKPIETGMFFNFADHSYPIKGVAPYPDDDGYILYQLIIEYLKV